MSEFQMKETAKLVSMLYPKESEEYNRLLEAFASFVEAEILPTAKNIDREGRFPKENIDKIFRQGFTNIAFPEQVGGLGLPYPIYVACVELVARACASTAISLAIHGTVCDGIYQFGNTAQHKEFLEPMIRGEKLGAFSLTEADAGSDARSITTKAEQEGEDWLIDGSKMFISNSGVADYYFVFAKSQDGFASFIVPKDSKGFSYGENIPKLGLKGSTLRGLYFDHVRVPKQNLVGNVGEGFKYAKRMLLGGRITVAAISVGIAQTAFEKSVKYATQRRAFGSKVSDFQMTRSKIAEMASEISEARLMTYYAAFLKGSRQPFGVEACKAKLIGTEMALRVCNEAIQIHGGFGYTDEADVHRHWRDAKLMTIGEGTSEIMKLVIANDAIGRSAMSRTSL